MGAWVRLLVLSAALAVSLGVASPATAGSCPDVRFVTLGSLVYRGEPLPEGAALETGASAGPGTLDASAGDDGCERVTSEVTALELTGLDPGVAIAVEGQPGWMYVLGYRCEGFAGAERLTCLGEPLLLDGTPHYARRYPADNGSRRTFTLGGPAGTAELAGDEVAVVAIEGVEPAVAVALAGRAEEAYVASEACLYVAADNRPSLDGLSRCLASPIWLLFDPPLAGTETRVLARSDRRVAAELDGAPVLLVPAIGGDAVPSDLSDAVAVGTLDVAADGTATVGFAVPEGLDQAVYESVVRCEACPPSADGRAVFAAGVLVVTGTGEGLDERTVVVLALLLLLVAVGASVFLVRRNRREPPPGQPRNGDGTPRGVG